MKVFFEDARYFLIKSANSENVILSKAKVSRKEIFPTRNVWIFTISENVHFLQGVWSTTPRNEQTLNKAFRETRNVILIFSVEKSQAFQGKTKGNCGSIYAYPPLQTTVWSLRYTLRPLQTTFLPYGSLFMISFSVSGFCRLASESLRDASPVNWVLPPGMNARNLGGVFKLHWINRNEVPFVNTSQLFNPWNEYKPVKIGRDGTVSGKFRSSHYSNRSKIWVFWRN